MIKYITNARRLRVSILLNDSIYIVIVITKITKVNARNITCNESFHTQDSQRESKPYTGPLQAQKVAGDLGSQISRKFEHEGGKVVNTTHRMPLPSRNIPGTHFC